MDDKTKITDGLNDRPLNDTIAQTGGGLPDDSGRQVELDPAEVGKMRPELQGFGGEKVGKEAREDPDPPQSGAD